MKAQSLWHGAIISSSLVGLLLAGTLIFKVYSAKPINKFQTRYVKLDPSKVSQIKIIKPRSGPAKTSKRNVASAHNTTINALFSPFGPLKDLSARERFHFKKEVLGYVDSKIRRGSIDPRNRFRYIEMKVLDKSLEMLEARATN